MFEATIAGVIAGLYQNEGVAVLIVSDITGEPVRGSRFTAAGQPFTLVDGFDHTPEAPEFPMPEGRTMALIVTPDDTLFELSDVLAGQIIRIGD